MDSSRCLDAGVRRPAFSRLPVAIDVVPLLAALAEIDEGQWQAHFNHGYYEGDWSGVALISPADATSELTHGEGPAVQRQPWRDDARWQQGLRGLDVEIRSARLMRLGPNSHIHEHRDYDLGGADADMRLHVPLLTPEQVDFMLESRRVPMQAGECWFLDLNRPHSVNNHDSSPRVHLVIDCRPGPWLDAAIENGLATTPAPGIGRFAAAFAGFSRWLERQPQACARLQALSDRDSFIEQTLALAAEQGFVFSHAQVRAAMRQGRSSWSDQWKV
ncbi:Aspartyl/Asparaginyl beta-hydroxylase [Pseudomonas japonica]|uniref:Aspartyl/Asparaginyl beta-hydroxylase n=1 Tax=Pseudomonas japonica TaxID=256466 RepID=A0A239FKE5_9PSED|nr:Aspartyl/Asparaginyl beta-hydroxylase [Pseudomonas japonica]